MTCENAIFTNCTIKDGKININTSSKTIDSISLNYHYEDGGTFYKDTNLSMSPYSIMLSDQGASTDCSIEINASKITFRDELNPDCVVEIEASGVYGNIRPVNGYTGSFWYGTSPNKVTVTVSKGIITNISTS